MKCINVMVFILTICALSASLVSSNHPKLEKVHSEVLSYVHQNMRNNRIMMRGMSAHLDCYNEFIPFINYLASNARDVSNDCIIDANKQKDQELSVVMKERQNIESEANEIKKSLADCSEKVGLEYFKCLSDNAEVNKQLMETIRDKSKDLISKYAEKSAEIDQNEQICLMDAIDMAKIASDKAFVDLKSCLNGGPAIQLLY